MAQDLQDIKSIFDFFYIDNNKIKSFYAQLNGLGSLTSLKNTSQISDSRKLEATAGLPPMAGGKMASDHTANTSSESVYDGIPTMPREMINSLDELGFIHRDLNESMLGNLVLYEGTLGIIDFGVAKEMMNPALNVHIKDLQKDSQTKKLAQELKTNQKDVVDFFKSIPFGLEAKLLVDTGRIDENSVRICDEVWMTLNRDEMTGSHYDVNFKHGEFLAGKWYVLGILDALPFDGFTFDTERNELREGVSTLISLMKNFVGRPQTAYGLTPVAIFRVLKPRTR